MDANCSGTIPTAIDVDNLNGQSQYNATYSSHGKHGDPRPMVIPGEVCRKPEQPTRHISNLFKMGSIERSMDIGHVNYVLHAIEKWGEELDRSNEQGIPSRMQAARVRLGEMLDYEDIHGYGSLVDWTAPEIVVIQMYRDRVKIREAQEEALSAPSAVRQPD